jgi:hypothetical protein
MSGSRDVESMVVALFTLNAAIERARRERKAARALNLLQVIASCEAKRPSEIAARPMASVGARERPSTVGRTWARQTLRGRAASVVENAG